MEKLPEGRTSSSRKKFWESLVEDSKHPPVTKCISDMEGKVSDPGAFCGSLADRVLGKGWRSNASNKKSGSLGRIQASLADAVDLVGQPLRTRRDYGTKDSPEGVTSAK
jgi:hypothetical protein